jgi:DNA-binding NarL/FixJ family response regulator
VSEPPVISIVDDDASIREALDGLLRSAGLQAAAFGSVEEFLGSGHLATTGCLILDLRMPGIDDLELQEWLLAEGRRIPIIPDRQRRRRRARPGAGGGRAGVPAQAVRHRRPVRRRERGAGWR